jgi:hypothetical protein
VFGFETESTSLDVPGILDSLSELPFIHAGHPIHQDITKQSLFFLKDTVLNRI